MTHSCIVQAPSVPGYYKQGVQALTQFLFKRGWFFSHYFVGCLFGEPVLTLSKAKERFSDWRPHWTAPGFYDVSTAEGFARFARETLKTNNCVPILLLHAVYSTPADWNSWIPELTAAQKSDKIGPVITLQLPDDLGQALPLVNRTILSIGKRFPQIDLVGHSRGGQIAHLVSFSSTTNVERRWHTDERNPLVRQVISIASPTWLCCNGQKEENSMLLFPEKGFTSEQTQRIADTHTHLVDFVALEDAFEPTTSPLPQEQVYVINHGHLGALCPQVCKKAIDVLITRSGKLDFAAEDPVDRDRVGND